MPDHDVVHTKRLLLKLFDFAHAVWWPEQRARTVTMGHSGACGQHGEVSVTGRSGASGVKNGEPRETPRLSRFPV